MIRPAVPSDFNPSKSDLVFQVVDWKSCDVIDEKAYEDEEEDEEEDAPKKRPANKKKLLIRGYGVTEEGHSICVHIESFQPYFYFKIPDGWSEAQFISFRETVKMMVEDYNRGGLVNASIVEKKEFYGFTNNEFFKYGVFIFKNQTSYYSYLRVFKEKTIVMRKLGVELDMSKKLYETKVSSLLRFFHVRDLDPSGWCRVPAGQYRLNTSRVDKATRCQIDITTTFDKMEKVDKSSIGKLVIASFDLECSSEDGTFPKPERPYDQVIQIGTTVYVFGNPECQFKYIATLKRCLPIDGVLVESYDTERDMILGWSRFMANLDPDIITGYNIWGFDWEFLYKRAEYGFQQDATKPSVSFHQILYRNLQRIRPLKTYHNMDDGNDPNVKLTVQNLSSAALGDNFLKFIDIEGIVQIDLLKVVMRDHKLESYKLDNVAQHFMKLNKVDLSPNELFKNFREGTPEKIQEIAIYCIMDCKLVNELINKLDVITANMGMANVCVVPFSYLFLRGQGIKIFSLVAKFCRAENFLIKDLSEDDIDKNSYEGAIVFSPKPGVYFEPVVVMDYNSLYPSSMIAENISHDSIVGFEEYHLKPGMKGDKPEDYQLIKDTMNRKYEGLPGYHYIDIEYDLFRDDESGETTRDENGKKESKKKKFGFKKCRFAEADNMDKSVLPRILRTLLKARKDTRKKMEYVTHTMNDGSLEIGIPTELPDGRIELFHVEKGKYCIQKEDVANAEDTYNEFEQSVLDGLQLAYKVTCNSLYGQVGATTSPICYKELAACTTATGRKMVITARDLTLQTFEGSSLVYGDTDSVFINFTGHIKMNNPGKDLTEYDLLVESIQMGVKAAKNINSHMKAPQNIEYEKTLWPFCIFSKKRYIGNLYEHDPKKYKLKYMGIVLKRRDNAPVVKTIYGGVLDKILNGSRSVEDSIRFFRSSIQDLLDGKVNISQLAISKSLKSEYANPNQIAHKVLADRMGERDPGNKPQSNDRIPYCYIDSCNLKCMICRGSVNVEKCKCVVCMKMFCSTHLVRHKEKCVKVCRFCKLNEKETKLVKCGTCLAYYCGKCNTKHKTRVDGKTGQSHTDKCKKALTSKILQGDILEHPDYIQEAGLKIDYRYYFDHQIWEPVRQIFALVSDNPDSIVADILRKNDNAKKGNHEITDWFAKMKQMSSPPPPEPVVVVPEVVEEEEVASAGAGNALVGILPEKKMKKIPMKIDSKFDVKCDINAPPDADDEEGDMLAGDFEADSDSDMEGMELDECAFDMDA